MKIKTNVTQVIESLPDGQILRKTFTWILRFLAGLVVLLGILTILGMIGNLIDHYSIPVALGTLLALVVVFSGTFIAFFVFYIKSYNIQKRSDRDYPIMVLSSLLLKTFGEISAVYLLTTGLATGILIWFGAPSFLPHIPASWQVLWVLFGGPSTPQFLVGLTIIISNFLHGALALLFFYLLSEAILLFRQLR